MLEQLAPNQAVEILESSPLAMLLLDHAGKVRACNRAMLELIGKSGHECPDKFSSISGAVRLSPLLGTDTLVRWIDPNDRMRILEIDVIPLKGKDAGSVRFYRDVTSRQQVERERNQLIEKTRELSLKDRTLTSLLNRRGMLLLLEPLVARSRRYNNPLSVVMLAISTQQKDISLLDKVAELLMDQLRWADLVGCNDQHDFIVVLQETERDDAVKLSGKLNKHLAQLADNQLNHRINMYYGITDCRKNDNADSLLHRAQSALEAACGNGRGNLHVL